MKKTHGAKKVSSKKKSQRRRDEPSLPPSVRRHATPARSKLSMTRRSSASLASRALRRLSKTRVCRASERANAAASVEMAPSVSGVGTAFSAGSVAPGAARGAGARPQRWRET